jgi:chromosome segregation ATPase
VDLPARKLQRNNSVLVGAKAKLERKVKKLEAELEELRQKQSSTTTTSPASDTKLQEQLDDSLREQGRLRQSLDELRTTERDLLAKLRVAERRGQDGTAAPAQGGDGVELTDRVQHLERLLKRKEDELQELDERLNETMGGMRASQAATRAAEDALEEARDESTALRQQLKAASAQKLASNEEDPSSRDASVTEDTLRRQLAEAADREAALETRLADAKRRHAANGETQALRQQLTNMETLVAECQQAQQAAERRALKAESELERDRLEREALQSTCEELQAAVDTLSSRNDRAEEDQAVEDAIADLARRVADYEAEYVSLQSLRATITDEMKNLRSIQLNPEAFIEKHLTLQRRNQRLKRGEVRELEQELNREIKAKVAAEEELNRLRAEGDAALTEMRQSFEEVGSVLSRQRPRCRILHIRLFSPATAFNKVLLLWLFRFSPCRSWQFTLSLSAGGVYAQAGAGARHDGTRRDESASV